MTTNHCDNCGRSIATKAVQVRDGAPFERINLCADCRRPSSPQAGGLRDQLEAYKRESYL